MRLIRVIFLSLLLVGILGAKEQPISISFKDLSIMDLVGITSKIIDKNILITQKIKGKVDFISNKPLYKDDVVNVLIYVLETKGFTLVDNDGILRIIKLSDGARYNAPVISGDNTQNHYQMVTEVFSIKNTNVEYLNSKVRHLISKTAKIFPDKVSNSLMITDFPSNIRTVKKVIALLTKDKKKTIEVIELKNIQANDAKGSLINIAKSMYNFKIEEEKIDILANKENNSVTIIGKPKNVQYLTKYMIRLDSQSNKTKRVVEVYGLKNVEAKNVIKIIDGIVGKRKYIDANAKPLYSVDEESNAIVLMGQSDEIDYIKSLLSQLDKEKAQVYVEAKIIEVNDNLIDEIGIKYGIFGGKGNSSGLGTFSSSLNGGSSVIDVPSNFNLNIPDLSSGLALGASISLLDQDGALDIVSEPSILAINNKESSIYVGETISVKTSSSVTDGGTQNDNFKREDVGLTLKVKPRISNDNKVTLEINTILEDVKTTDTTSGNADTSKKEVKTTAIVNNGEAVILGGLIQDKEESTESKVPGLGDIPLLGSLFTHDKTDITKKSLVIIVTPYIIPKSKDLTFVRNQLSHLKFLEQKYLKDSLVRLKQRQLKKLKQDKQYHETMQELNEKIEEVKSKDSTSQTIKGKDANQTLHEERMQEYFGM